jgi:ornithine cyclodeaminase/alanine dehydrogenase-like protein (mu-crystallin family)
MKSIEFLYLSQEDVIKVGLSMLDTISVVENVLKEHADKAVENPPKPGVHPLEDAFIHAMPAYLPRKGISGLKWVSGFFGNQRFGLPSIMGLLVLNDVSTGQPIAVMEAGYITAIRTAAMSGVAARYLAVSGAKRVGVVGAGIQGRYNLLTLKEVLPGIECVRVHDTDSHAAARLKEVLRGHVSFEIEIRASVQEVFEEADIVITAIGRPRGRIFKEEWVKPGALILPVGPRGWETAAIGKMDKFVVDDWGQFSHLYDGEGGYYAPLPMLHAELSEIVTGKKPGRESTAERIINFNLGMAILDIGLGSEILERARQKNLGRVLPLMTESMPFF